MDTNGVVGKALQTRWMAVVAVAGGALVLAACGGSNSDTESTSVSPTGVDTTVAGNSLLTESVDRFGRRRRSTATTVDGSATTTVSSPTPSPAPAPTSASTTVSSAPAPTTPSGASWVSCAREGAACSFAGRREVRYAAVNGSRVLTAVAENGVACVDATFKAPTTDYENLCSYSSVTTSAPVTAVAVMVPSATATAPTTSPSPAPAAAPAPSPAPAPSTAPTTAGTSVGPRTTTFAASAPLTASAGQVISGVRISNTAGPCIVIPGGASNVVIRDSDIGPCAGDASIVVQGTGATIEHNYIHEGRRGILAASTSGTTIALNKVHGPFAGNSCGNASNPSHCSSAIQVDKVQGATISGNQVRGSGYGSDAVSVYESSSTRLVDNDIDVNIAWMHAAGFTMGDSTTGNPGRDNYVAGNVVRQTGGVPAGVFGSNGNTILEKNCFSAGIQAFNYSGTFVGVTVRNNVINIGASFVPDTSVVGGWSTNINSTDCSLVPR